MKILHVTDHLPNYHKTWGGAEQVAYRYIKLLSGRKDEVFVCGVKPQKQYSEEFKFKRIIVLEDFFPERFQPYITGLKNRIFPFDPISFFHFLFRLGEIKPSVVHFHKFNKISYSAILAAKLCGIKTVLGIYDYWYFCPGGMLIDEQRNLCRKFHGAWCKDCSAVRDFRFLLPLTTPVRRPFFNLFLNRIDAFAVLSNSLKELLTEYGIKKNKIYLVRQVFNLKEEEKKETEENNWILYVGWIDPRKGPDIAIQTAVEVLKTNPDVKLYMIGEALDKTYEKEILKMLEEKNLKNKVFLLGRKQYSEVVSFYNKSRVVLVPEQWENMSPVVLVEAMNFRKAVVASNIGGLPEFIEDKISGFLVKHNKPEEFAEKTRLLLNDKSLAREMGKQAKSRVQTLCDPEEVYNSLKYLYESITEQKK